MRDDPAGVKTSITKEGQRYFDQPVLAQPKPVSRIGLSLAAAFRSALPQPIRLGFERTRLRWMKPDGRGGLVPK